MMKSILPGKVLVFARGLIDEFATESLHLTMSSSDDALPKWYPKLLHRKAEEGVKIRRIGFGDAEFFARSPNVHIDHPDYSFRFSSGKYERMLLVDQSKLLFKTREGAIWYTEDRDMILKHLQYFNGNWVE